MNVRLVALLLCLLAVAPSALAAGTGPFTGAVREGQTDRHRYDDNPGNDLCPQVIVFYTVSLTYTPASDTLTLKAGGQTAVGSGGVASVGFEAGACAAFTIQVTGTDVATTASYVATVGQGGGAPA